MEKTQIFEWPPLESDPEIFIQYFWNVGLLEKYYFDELLTLDYKEVQIINNKVLGVIIAGNEIKRNKDKFIDDYKNIPFFIKQIKELDNACGLIAGLHLIGNIKKIEMRENSLLDSFFSQCLLKSPLERGELLNRNNEFKEIQKITASLGQSEMPSNQEDVKYHYVSFIEIDNKLYELDGTQDGPIIIQKQDNNQNLLDSVIQEIKIRIEQNLLDEKCSFLILQEIQNSDKL